MSWQEKELKDALTFYDLREDYNYNALLNAHLKFLDAYQDSHRFQNIDKEELDKANRYYDLLSRRKGEDNSFKASLAILKFDFKNQLEIIKKRYQDKEIIALCDLTLKKVLETRTLEELKTLRQEFNKLFRETLENIKDKFREDIRDEFNKEELEEEKPRNYDYNEEIKEDLKKYFSSLYLKNSKEYRDFEIENYKDFKADLDFLITSLKAPELNLVLNLLNNITFNDYLNDLKILNKIGRAIYINKETGEIFALKRKEDDKAIYYNINDKRVMETSNIEFSNNFISLKKFMRKALFVYDKKVSLKDNDTIYLRSDNINVIYATKEMILVVDGEDNNEFSFYPKSVFTENEAYYSVGESLIKDDSNMKFKDKDLTYQILVDYYRNKNMKEDNLRHSSFK